MKALKFVPLFILLLLGSYPASAGSTPPQVGGELAEILLKAPTDDRDKDYLGVTGKTMFKISEIRARLVIIDKSGIIRSILVSDINNRPKLEWCATGLKELEKELMIERSDTTTLDHFSHFVYLEHANAPLYVIAAMNTCNLTT